MNHLFLVTSALNTSFGLYDADQRLLQTLTTIESIRERVPNAKIAIFESSGNPISSEVLDTLTNNSDWVANMSQDPTINYIHGATDNWDIVKNACEMMAFKAGINMLETQNAFDGIDRVHKLSGRYILNDDFDLSIYETYPDKIILTQKYMSQFTSGVSIPYQYVSRLWSWPRLHHPVVKDFYEKAISELDIRMKNNMYADIEHLLYHFLPGCFIQEVPIIGVAGRLGQNGVLVQN
jgi:hypothetical protein